MIRHAARYHCPGTYEREPADDQIRQYHRACADRRTIAHQRRANLPIGIGLERTLDCDGAWKHIVGEAGTWTDEDAILDRDAMVDKCPILDFDIVTNPDTTVDIGPFADDAIVAE